MPPYSAHQINARLDELGIVLPIPAAPQAAFVPFVRSGDLVFLSGHIAKRDGRPWTGQLGRDTTTDEGRAAARSIAIDLLGTLQQAAGGLERVARVVKVTSFVNSTPVFTEHHLVTNGCSELLVQVLGERGAHARSAFGTAQLPMGACVEIEMVAQLL
jgi:enamine deaminase RidA (YjgF/YER057c/UK114 family)